MAAPRLLAKTDLSAHAPVMEGGRAVIEQHGRLAALLAARGLPPGLFAEPVITRGADGAPASVSWYGEADGEPVPLSSLSPARRAEAERALAAALATLVPALDDADAGGLLRRALLLADPDSVLAVDGGVVLTGWALAPRGTAGEPEGLATRLREGLGRYHPALAAAGAGFFSGAAMAPAAAEPAAPPPAPPPAAPRMQAAPSPPPPPRPPVVEGGGRPAWWWMLPAGLAIALLFLLFGVWLGLRLCTSEFAGRELRASVVDEAAAREAIARQREANTRLEREIAAARAALTGDICRPAGPLAPIAPPSEPTPPAPITPPAEGTPPPPAEGAPPTQGSVPAPDGGTAATLANPEEAGAPKAPDDPAQPPATPPATQR